MRLRNIPKQMTKKPTKQKLGRPFVYQEDLDFINIEVKKLQAKGNRAMNQPEFIQALLAIYKKHWKV